MDSARRFAVEKVEETVAIVGDVTFFGDVVETYFSQNGYQVKRVGQGANLDEYDVLCVFASHESQILIPQPRPGARLYYIEPLYRSRGGDDVPHSAVHIRYADFLGGESACASLIDHFLLECKNDKHMTIPGDGLDTYHIAAKGDLDRALITVLSMSNPPAENILCNGDTLSVHMIADAIRSTVPYKISVDFKDTLKGPEQVRLSDENMRASSHVSWTSSEKVLAMLPLYIDSFFDRATPPVSIGAQPFTKSSFRHDTSKESELTVPTPSKEPISVKAPVFVPASRVSRRRLTPLKVMRPRRERRVLPLGWRIAVGSLIVAASIYMCSLVGAVTITVLSFKNLVAQTRQGTFITPVAAKTARIPAVYLQANVSVGLGIMGLRSSEGGSELIKLLSAYLLALETSANGFELAATGQAISSYVVGEGEGDLVSHINQARLNIDTTFSNLSLLDGQLPPSPPWIIPAKYHEQYLEVKARIQEARRAALTGKSLLNIAPDILGVGDRRKYLVLFQNNMELRPTGGFIGSFGLISLENGKLFDIQVYDVYSADGQLKGHVEPPEEIKKYLGEANWFMRDSNWDPDFPTSARRAEWYLSKTMGYDVNGVVGINLFTLQEILRATGTLRIAEYDEDITADNLFERAEYHAEVNFFPGSQGKKEFIATVADELLHKLEATSGIEVLSVVRGLTKSIDERHTMLALGNDVTERTLTTLGWSGELRETPCPDGSVSCTSDYAMLVDSNFGINKANYFVRRTLNLDVVINDDMSIDHTLQATYTNTAKSSAWPAGPYKSYSRLYLPEGSVVSSVRIGDKELKKEDISIKAEHGRVIAGFLVEVPLDSTATVDVQYTAGSKVAGEGSMYSLYWQKQSGTSPDPLKVSLKYPAKLIPEIVSPKGEYAPGSLNFALSNVTDRRVTVKFK